MANEKRISDSNKGFQLLKKAGWVEGTGLGANKQGTITPLNPWVNQGRRGIGCTKPKTQIPNSTPKIKHDSANKQTRKRKRKPKHNAKTPDQDRQKHVRILKQLSEMDSSDQLDSNPLLRSNALSVSNPLIP